MFEYEPDSRRAVVRELHARDYDAAAPLAADDCAVLRHRLGDESLTDGRAYDGRAVTLGHALDRTARRDVRDDRAHFPAQLNLGAERQRRLLAENLAPLGHYPEPLAVRVAREAYVGAPGPPPRAPPRPRL